MITGSNTNVRHRGRLYHVQTEDSGKRHPHVISHLYHGGTIVASEKKSYAELLDLDANALVSEVRALMEQQHKAMVKRLKNGGFDALIAERLRADKAGKAAVDNAATPGVPPTQPALGAAPPAPREPDRAQENRAFGDGIVSQKPLDEVILEYLVEKARDRSGGRAVKAPPESRRKG